MVTPREVSPAFNTAIEGTWFVKTAAGVQTLTLDELDEKFQRGEVSATTPVFTAGMTAWDTLGAIAGLEDVANSAGTAVPSARIVEEVFEVDLEPIEGDSFPPMTAGVFGTDGPPWASRAPEKEAHTVVRRSTGVIPFSVRKAVAGLADSIAELRLTRPRLLATGPWLFGAALSGIFTFSLYQLATAGTRPGEQAKSDLITARATSAEAPSAATARPVGDSPSAPSLAPARAASNREPAESSKAAVAARAGDVDPGAIALLRTQDLRLAAPTRSDAQLARSARAKAKAAKAVSARKAKARVARQATKRARKQRSAAALY